MTLESSRPMAAMDLRQRHVVGQEVPGGLAVEAISDICRAAVRVAGRSDAGDDVGLIGAGAEEVGATGVPVAGASLTLLRVLAEVQVGGSQRVEGPDRVAAGLGVGGRRATRAADELGVPVADGG